MHTRDIETALMLGALILLFSWIGVGISEAAAPLFESWEAISSALENGRAAQ